MANDCFYQMKVVAKDKETIERLISIMKYDDKEYYIYRCFEAMADEIKKEDDYFTTIISGDVAWSASDWFNGNENVKSKTEKGAHYVSVDILCKRLGFAVECFTQEPGMQFEEHYIVNNKGEIIIDETEDWGQNWEDEEGNELMEPEEWGGFDYWGNFNTAYDLWNDRF